MAQYFVKIEVEDWIEANSEQEAKEKALIFADEAVEVLAVKQ